MKKLLLSGFLFCSLLGFASQEIPTPVTAPFIGIEMPTEWTEYTTIDGVKIEYRMKECEGKGMRPQNLLLFKFTNTTDQELTISWATKIFRNDFCTNCDRLESSEYAHSITLQPNEVLEGDGTTKVNKDVYIFGNFVNLVPGMSDQRLTNFELVNLAVQ